MHESRVVVLAGPNGSGKTSVIEGLLDEAQEEGSRLVLPERIINPDAVRKLPQTLDLARELRIHPDLAAQQVAYKYRQEAMAERQSFAFETVMSHPSKLGELAQLRAQGYKIQLIFVTTKHPDINVARVKFRVKSGTTTGHDVPEDKTRSRYDRTMAMLPAAIELADQVQLYDNSYDGQLYSEQAIISQSFDVETTSPERFTVEVADSLEPWAEAAIDALSARQARRQDLAEYARNNGLDIVLADIAAGQYSGQPTTLGEPDFFCTRGDAPSRPTLVVHDLSTFMPGQLSHIAEMMKRDTITIRYSTTKEPQLAGLEKPRLVPVRQNMNRDWK